MKKSLAFLFLRNQFKITIIWVLRFHSLKSTGINCSTLSFIITKGKQRRTSEHTLLAKLSRKSPTVHVLIKDLLCLSLASTACASCASPGDASSPSPLTRRRQSSVVLLTNSAHMRESRSVSLMKALQIRGFKQWQFQPENHLQVCFTQVFYLSLCVRRHDGKINQRKKKSCSLLDIKSQGAPCALCTCPCFPVSKTKATRVINSIDLSSSSLFIQPGNLDWSTVGQPIDSIDTCGGELFPFW